MYFPYKSQLRSWWNVRLFPASGHEQVMAPGQWSRGQTQLAWVALLVASTCVLAPNLSYPLIDPDETRYAQIAIEMNASGDWITPTLGGEPYLDKPPLVYWMTALSFRIFGTNETAARIPSVISALLSIIATFALGSRIVGRRAAWVGAMALSLSAGFVMAGRFLVLDSVLTLFTTLCFLTGYIAVRDTKHRWVWWMASGIACALGVLVKGPVALVLCAPPLAVSGWLRADKTRVRAVHWAAFVIPMAVFCIPWYYAVMKANAEFADYFFLEHNLKRFTEGSNHKQPFWFYVPVIFAGMFPASLLIPSVAFFAFRRTNQRRRLQTKDFGFLCCGAVWVLAFFSIASCKLPTYILPALPLLCLMIGNMVDQTVLRPELTNGITNYLKPFPQRASLIYVVCCLAIAGADIALAGISLATILACVICVISTIAIVRFWNRPFAFSAGGWAASTVLAVAMLSFASTRLMPTVSESRSLYAKAAQKALQNPDAMVVFYDERAHGVQLQIDPRRVVYFPNDQYDEFVAYIGQSSDSIVITEQGYAKKAGEAISSTHQLHRQPAHRRLFFAERIDASPESVANLPSSQHH